MSHPSQAARRMLELKGIDYRTGKVLPGMQRVQVRLLGFPGGTVPALKLDGRRIQGSRQIARALDELRPDPPLFPADPELRRQADEAERWGDEEFQEFPRRILRWGLEQHVWLRRWLAQASGLPAPGLTARMSGLNARYYARLAHADEEAVRRDLAALPEALAHADALLTQGILAVDPPNAAALQVLCTVAALEGMTDLHDQVAAHPVAAAAARLFPDLPGPVPPFLPAAWLAGA